MTKLEDGVATYDTRVESWECDFNGHWNTRYYARSFQAASDVLASMAGAGSNREVCLRQLRFHRELLTGDAVQIRSFSAPDGKGGTAVAHYMMRDDAIVATALHMGAPAPGHLPELSAEQARLALPRGVDGAVHSPWTADPAVDSVVELGPTRPADYDHNANLLLEALLGHCAIASHVHAFKLGFTLQFTRDTGVGRMLAELRLTHLGGCQPGTCLAAASRLTAVGGKAFMTAHYLHTRTGEPIAMFELSTLAVDMKTRRATVLPAFVRLPPGS